MNRYRQSGADLPFGDPLPWHGVSLEGYYWRFTDPVSQRVVIALVGINSPRAGGRWATVGIAAEPEKVIATAALPNAAAHMGRLGVRVGEQVLAFADEVRIEVGDCRV